VAINAPKGINPANGGDAMRVELAGQPAGARAAGWDSGEKSAIRRLHANDRALLVKHNLASAAVLGLMAAALWTWQAGLWPLTIVAWLLAGHFAHAKVIALHEAAHGTLNARRFLNELQGTLIGAVIFVPLSAYRICHARHHAYLASPRDPELWPFTMPGTPRWPRRLAAGAEITLGFVYTPLLVLRGVIVSGPLSPDQRRRLLAEYGLSVLIWSTMIGVVAAGGWWAQWSVACLAPMLLAGSFQTLNKYTEHMGLLGDTVLSSTRTVVDPRPWGKLLSRSLLNVDYHGTHHRYAKVPYYNLPAATPYVFDRHAATAPVYATYVAALCAMIRTLTNPRVGRQWLEEEVDGRGGRADGESRLY
jgi:fatty acid desaturase